MGLVLIYRRAARAEKTGHCSGLVMFVLRDECAHLEEDGGNPRKLWLSGHYGNAF